MNHSMTYPNDLLDRMTDAARNDVPQDTLDAAVRRFRERLPTAEVSTVRRRRLPRWFGFAGAVATLVLAISILPLLLPGQSAGHAFAKAQAWFEDYRTLQLTQITRQGPTELYRLNVWHERGGATRIEIGPLVQIVDPVNSVMMRLGPNGELVSRQYLPGLADTRDGRAAQALVEQEELAWLKELRTFRGQAEPVETSRDIDGIGARGWTLELSGMRHTLWVDPADHRPLLLEGAFPAGMTMVTRFVFDAPIPDGLFVPKAPPRPNGG